MELILLVQPDAPQASALRHALHERTNADVVIVDSKDAALAVIDRQVPDLMLLHALMPPEDEHQLVSHLRTLPDAAHLQTLTIPQLKLPSDGAGRKRSLLGGLRPRQSLASLIACEPRTFAGEVVDYLSRARAIKKEVELAALASESLNTELERVPAELAQPARAEGLPAVVTIRQEEVAPDATSASDRRGTRRWLPAEVPWVQAVRLAREPAELVNISSGGVLIRTGLRPEMEALKPYRLAAGSPLDLIFCLTSGRDVLAPSRIVRCRVVSVGSGPLRYDVAFRFDAAVGLDLPDETLALGEILNQPLTVRTDRLARLLSRGALPASAREALSELTAVDTALGEIQLTLREARRAATVNATLRDLTSRLGPRIRQLQTLRTELVERISRNLMAVPAA